MAIKAVKVVWVKIGPDYVRVQFKCKPNLWTGSEGDHVTHYAPVGSAMTHTMIEDLVNTALAEAAELS